MKKRIEFLLLFLAAVVFFYGCEKESLELPTTEPDVNVTKDTPNKNAMETIDLAKVERIDTTPISLSLKSQVANKSGRELIQQFDITLNSGYWFFKPFYKTQLSKEYRYVAVVVPVYGDPDLYVHGRQPNGTFRFIRRFNYPGTATEEISATLDDLSPSEDRLYFNVWANSFTRFKLYIYREPVCYNNGCLAGKYFIKSALGTYLDIKGGSAASGTDVWAYAFNGSAAQKWTLIHAGGNYYYIKSDLGTYLDVYGANPASGTNVWAYAFNGSPAQKWLVFLSQGDGDGVGHYYIQSALSTYLDIKGGSAASGTDVWAFKYNGSVAQKWKLLQAK